MLLSHTSNEEYNLTSNKFEDLLWEEIKVTKPTGYLDKRVVYLDFHQYLTFEIKFTKRWAAGVRAEARTWAEAGGDRTVGRRSRSWAREPLAASGKSVPAERGGATGGTTLAKPRRSRRDEPVREGRKRTTFLGRANVPL